MIGSLDLAAAVLLLAAGLAKLRAPEPAASMLRRAVPRLARGGALPVAVRVAGVLEAGVGAAVALTGTRAALVLLTGCYAAFALVSLRLTTLGQRASCGCFGRTDSPVGVPHVLLNLACAGIAAAGAARPPGPFGGLFDGDPLPGVIGTAQAGLLAYLGFLSITALPALAAERRRVSA